MLGIAFLTHRIKGQGSCLSAVQALTQALSGNQWQWCLGKDRTLQCALGSALLPV